MFSPEVLFLLGLGDIRFPDPYHTPPAAAGNESAGGAGLPPPG
jgi:hypothetical protein